MAFKPSLEQGAVIRHRGASLLVAASAGSGKTSTIIEHVMHYLKEGGDINRLILVTYTRAAAAEMKERLRRRLEKEMKAEPENSRLRHQWALLGLARISTIDSLCYQLVRSHFQNIPDLPPDLRIAQEAELDLIKQDVVEALLEEEYQAADPAFYDFLDAYSNEKDHGRVAELILTLYESSRNDPFPEEWLERAVKRFPDHPGELADLPWVQAKKAALDRVLRRALEEQEALLQEIGPDTDMGEAFRAYILQDIRDTQDLLGRKDYFDLVRGLIDLSVQACRKKAEREAPFYPFFSEKRGSLSGSGYWSRVGALRDPKALGAEEALRMLKLTEEPARMLAALTRIFAQRLRESCLKRSLASFADIEHYARELLLKREADGTLRPTELAESLSAGIDEIIIDEYQDINQVQEYIMLALSGEMQDRPNLLMVGDIKQSIYRFRRADPEIFAGKYDTFTPLPQGRHQRIDFLENYRSRERVLRCANQLFSLMMSRDFGGTDYARRALLRAGASYPGEDTIPRMMLLQTEQPAEEAIALQGRMIAGKIKELMEKGSPIRDGASQDPQALRPMNYRDMVILTQSAESGSRLARVLRSFGIPAVAQDKKGFYDTREVQTMLALLKILDNPRQDIPLGVVLLSPLGGFRQEELAEFAAAEESKKGDYYDRLLGAESHPLYPRIRAFFDKVHGWRQLAQLLSVPGLMESILEESGYEYYLAAMPSGPVRLANLEQLKEMARSYEESTYRGLYQFLRYVERQRKLSLDISEAPLLSDGSDVVRVGTFHSSKGLEYPVVFLAALERGFNERELQGLMLIHDREGIALRTRDRENFLSYDNLWFQSVREKLQREARAERLRLLYVGMTRAMEHLYLVGAVKKTPEELCANYREKSPDSAASMLDWFLQAYARGYELDMEWTFIRESDLPQPEAAPEKRDKQLNQAAHQEDEAARRAFSAQLNCVYPHKSPGRLAYSVSELAEDTASEKQEQIRKTGYVLRESEEQAGVPELDAAARGTAFHKLMELLPLTAARDGEKIRAYLTSARQQGIFSQAEADSLPSEAVLSFYSHPIGERALQAAEQGQLWREQPFLLGLEEKELYPEEAGEELLLVQGIIDMYFEEPDGLVLVDYKTDRVKDPRALVPRYQRQLDYYARALQAARNRPVKEIYLYSSVHRCFVACAPLKTGNEPADVVF